MNIKRIFAGFVMSTVLFTTVVPTTFRGTYDVAYAADSGDLSLNGDILTMTKGSDKIDLQVCSSKIFKVNYKPGGEEDPETLVVDPNKKWDTGNIESSDLKSDPAIIKTSDMTIKISKSDLSISVFNADGTQIVQQQAISGSKSLAFSCPKGQDFYGISGYNKDKTPEDGTLRSGSYPVECGSQGYVGGPFTWSTGGYGILVDSDGGNMSIDESGVKYTGISKKNTEYFIMVGTPTEVMEGQAEVSGKAPMFPKWATGFTNTQWGWPEGSTPEDQLKEVIGKYRAGEYPIDNFCLDFDWKCWGQLEVPNGEFKWNTKNFPGAANGDLKKWADSQGLHLTGIMKPRLFLETDEAKTMDEKGWWYSEHQEKDYCAGKQVRICDFYNPDLRQWWWDQTADSFDNGMVGFWNDECDKENGFRNFDNLNMQRAMYEGQRAHTDDKTRVWSINRNFYTGAQRYAYGSWSGDIDSSFNSMKSQKDRLIAAVNLGEAKWGMDTGGFNGSPEPENYARWLEFSAFTPIFRVHGQKVPGATVRYPWAYGETAAAAAKNVMHLRYQLIPYIYKYDHQASETGVGLVKSMMMEYPNDPKSKANSDQWMFGDYLLVSPVLEQNQETKNIYLPEGNWIDYETGEKYEGGKEIAHKVDTKTWKDVPLFIKQGAIIPSQDYENYVGEKKMENIYVDVFPDSKETGFEYYDDDGESYDYENGNYFKQKLSVSRNDDWSAVAFKTGPKSGEYTPDVNSYIVKLHVTSKGAVTANKKELKEYKSLDELTALGNDKEGYASGKDKYGDVVYVKIKAGEIQTVEAPCDFPAGPEQTSNIYVDGIDSSSTLEYSADNGRTWTGDVSLEPSGYLGCLGATITCGLNSNALKIRINNDGDYIPSEDGVSLTASSGNFMISKDGKVQEMKSVNSAKIYIMSNNDDSSVPVIIQYKDGSKWSDSISLDPFGTNDGQYFKELLYSKDKSDITIRYSDDNGDTWKPSDEGTKVSTGEYQNSDDGSLIAGKPDWQNSVTVYYKTEYDKTYIHWCADGGNWTNAPGDEMETCSKFPGYVKKVLKIGEGSSVEACFNDGGDNWDSNEKQNYKIEKGIYTVKDTKVTAGDPEGKHAGTSGSSGTSTKPSSLTVSCDVKSGTYNDAQTVKLTASDSKASIYYTLDGTIPTAKSTKYSKAISITETTTLKFVAIDAEGNKSALNSQKYTIGSEEEKPDDKKPDDKKPQTDKYDKLETAGIKLSSSSIILGKTVKITASCNTENPEVEYSYGYYDSKDNWNEIKGYSTDITYTFKPTDEGKYQIVVRAKTDSEDEVESASKALTVKKETTGETPGTNEEVFSSVEISSDKTSLTVGDKVTFIATPDVDDGSIKYEYGYYDDDDSWVKIKSSVSSDEYTWTPDEADTYIIKVKATSSDTGKSVISKNSVKISVKEKTSNDQKPTFDNSSLAGIAIMSLLSVAIALGIKRKNKIAR